MRARFFLAPPLIALVAGAALSGSHASGGDKALGEYLAGECVACHLPSGRAVGAIPAITRLPEDAFIAMMQSYAKKERDNAAMQGIAAKFTDDELKALAAYFTGLPRP